MIFIVDYFCKKGFLKIEKNFNSWTIHLSLCLGCSYHIDIKSSVDSFERFNKISIHLTEKKYII